mgnify:CR=1 FL=1
MVYRADARLCEIIRQMCNAMGVTIINGALSCDHAHMFAAILPHVSVRDCVLRATGRSSRKIQQEFQHIRKRKWGQRVAPAPSLHGQTPNVLKGRNLPQ